VGNPGLPEYPSNNYVWGAAGTDVTETTRTGRARETSTRVYEAARRGTTALVVLVVSAGLAHLVGVDQTEGGALLLYAGVLLGYVLTSVWRRR
jgi:hypothetical protein